MVEYIRIAVKSIIVISLICILLIIPMMIFSSGGLVITQEQVDEFIAQKNLTPLDITMIKEYAIILYENENENEAGYYMLKHNKFKRIVDTHTKVELDPSQSVTIIADQSSNSVTGVIFHDPTVLEDALYIQISTDKGDLFRQIIIDNKFAYILIDPLMDPHYDTVKWSDIALLDIDNKKLATFSIGE